MAAMIEQAAAERIVQSQPKPTYRLHIEGSARILSGLGLSIRREILFKTASKVNNPFPGLSLIKRLHIKSEEQLWEYQHR
jgi:hypothetical protein